MAYTIAVTAVPAVSGGTDGGKLLEEGSIAEAKRDASDTCCCWSASCLQERTIMKIIPPNKNPSIPIMKITLQEKLALIPTTPESPATVDGSLHPSQAISDGRALVSNALSRDKHRSMA